MSIDGVAMESGDHSALIERIRSKQQEMRLVVFFEDCRRKVQLHLRLGKLKVRVHFASNLIVTLLLVNATACICYRIR